MKLEPGRLYRIGQYFWYLFPTKKTAAAAAAVASAAALAAATAAARAAYLASYWSKEPNCTVSFLNEGDTLMVVEVSNDQVKVINQEGKGGWINFPDGEEWAEGTIVEVVDGH